MSCSRTQHGGGRSRTPDLSLRSPTLYHWATALPHVHLGYKLYTIYHDPSSSSFLDILFTQFHRFTLRKSKKERNSATRGPTENKKIQVPLFFMLVLYIHFQDPISNGSWPYPSVMDRRTDGQAQTNKAPQLLQSWGHKNNWVHFSQQKNHSLRIKYL